MPRSCYAVRLAKAIAERSSSRSLSFEAGEKESNQLGPAATLYRLSRASRDPPLTALQMTLPGLALISSRQGGVSAEHGRDALKEYEEVSGVVELMKVLRLHVAWLDRYIYEPLLEVS